MSKYREELANVVKTFLTEDDWQFSFDENKGMFDFGLRIKSRIQKINYLVDVRKNELLVYGICPVCADRDEPEMMAQMAEFLCRANYGLRNGCFEFDFRDGEIRFRSFIDCRNLTPSTEVVKNSILCTAAMFEQYSPGIVDIIFTGGNAKDAIVRCEKLRADELRARLGEISAGAADSGHTSASDEIRVNPFDGKKEGGTA